MWIYTANPERSHFHAPRACHKLPQIRGAKFGLDFIFEPGFPGLLGEGRASFVCLGLGQLPPPVLQECAVLREDVLPVAYLILYLAHSLGGHELRRGVQTPRVVTRMTLLSRSTQ